MIGQQYRIYPNEQQTRLLFQAEGNCRYVWNKSLEYNIKLYKEHGLLCWYNKSKDQSKPGWEGMSARLTAMKQTDAFLQITDSQSQQQMLRKLDTALKRCYVDGISKAPKFKYKGDPIGIAIPITNGNIAIGDNYIKIPKLGKVKAVVHRKIDGNLKSIVIKRDADHWYVSALYDCERIKPKWDFDNAIAFDLGVKYFSVSNEGEVIKAVPFARDMEDKIARASRRLVKKKKHSKNREKARIRFARLHRKVRNQRKDHHNKLTTSIAKRFAVVYMETLSITDMVKNPALAKSIHDQGWNLALQMLSYKTNVVQIDRWNPSTQICSCCGHQQKMTLAQRVYECEKCEAFIDRDINAAINIKREGELKLVGQGLAHIACISFKGIQEAVAL